MLQPNASLTCYALEPCMKPSSSVNDIEKYRVDQKKILYQHYDILEQLKAKYTVMQERISAKEQEDFEQEIQALKEFNGELKKFLPKVQALKELNGELKKLLQEEFAKKDTTG